LEKKEENDEMWDGESKKEGKKRKKKKQIEYFSFFFFFSFGKDPMWSNFFSCCVWKVRKQEREK